MSTDRRVVVEAIMHPISTADRIYNCATFQSSASLTSSPSIIKRNASGNIEGAKMIKHVGLESKKRVSSKA